MDRANTALRRVLGRDTAPVIRAGRSNGHAVAVVLLLAAALWMAATLGFVHRVVHPPTASGVAARSAASPGAPPGRAGTVAIPAHAHSGGGVIARLFGVHGDPNDCRLYDQLGSAYATLSVPPAMLPIVLPTARFHFFLGEAIARWVTLFDARGPPASR